MCDLKWSKLLTIFVYCFAMIPENELSDCWKDVLAKVKIKVERCGCNSAIRFDSSGMILTAIVMPILVACVVVFRNWLYQTNCILSFACNECTKTIRPLVSISRYEGRQPSLFSSGSAGICRHFKGIFECVWNSVLSFICVVRCLRYWNISEPHLLWAYKVSHICFWFKTLSNLHHYKRNDENACDDVLRILTFHASQESDKQNKKTKSISYACCASSHITAKHSKGNCDWTIMTRLQ